METQAPNNLANLVARANVQGRGSGSENLRVPNQSAGGRTFSLPESAYSKGPARQTSLEAVGREESRSGQRVGEGGRSGNGGDIRQVRPDARVQNNSQTTANQARTTGAGQAQGPAAPSATPSVAQARANVAEPASQVAQRTVTNPAQKSPVNTQAAASKVVANQAQASGTGTASPAPNMVYPTVQDARMPVLTSEPQQLARNSSPNAAAARAGFELGARGDATDSDARQGQREFRGQDQQRLEQVPVSEGNRVSASQAKQMLSPAPTSGSAESRAAGQIELISGILRQVEQFRQSARSAVQVSLPMPDGSEVRLWLQMQGQRLSMRLQTPSREVYDALHEGWASLAEQAATRGVQLSAPTFSRGQQGIHLESEGELLDNA